MVADTVAAAESAVKETCIFVEAGEAGWEDLENAALRVFIAAVRDAQ